MIPIRSPFRPGVPLRFFLCMLLVLAAFWPVPASGSEQITLAGKAYPVEMSGGKPQLAFHDGCGVHAITAGWMGFDHPYRCELAWKFDLEFPVGKVRGITIRPLLGGPTQMCSIMDLPPREGGKILRVGRQLVHLYPISRYPSLWEGFAGKDAFWTGFELTFLYKDAAQQPLVMTQLVKLYKFERDKAYFEVNENNRRIAALRKTVTLTLPSGEKFQASTFEDATEFLGDDVVTLAMLAPELVPDPAVKGHFVFRWVLEGHLHWEGDVGWTIGCPNLEDVQETGALVGPSKFKVNLFAPERFPKLWAWLHEPGDSWLPLELGFRRAADGASHRVLQGVFLSEATKKRILGLLKAPAGS